MSAATRPFDVDSIRADFPILQRMLDPETPMIYLDGGATSRIYSQSDFMHIGATEAWTVTHGDPNTLVAVIDTDVDATHPDLAGKVVVGRNFSGDETPDPRGGS